MVRWKYDAGGGIYVTPVGGAGVIYTVTSRGRIVAVDLAGKEVWSATHEVQSSIEGEPPRTASFSSPLLLAGDLLVAASDSGMVYAMEAASGKLRWTYNAQSGIQGTPNFAVMPDGSARVFIVCHDDGKVHAITASDGSPAWVSEPQARTDGHIATGDGRIVFGSCDASVHGLSIADGKTVGFVGLGEGCEMAGGLALAGSRAFIGNRSGAMVCADLKTGESVWENNSGDEQLFTAPALTADMVVFVTGDGQLICAKQANGDVAWEVATDAMVATAPVILGNHVIVGMDGALRAYQMSDGKMAWSHEVSDDITSPAIVDGLLILGTDDGRLMAFGAPK